MSASVEKKHRLSRSADFQKVYRNGKSVAGRYAVLYYFERASENCGGPRLGVSVSRKVGGAVVRNQVKRVLKEVFRARKDTVAPNYDYVIIARPGLPEYMEKSRFDEVVEMITGLFRRANLIQEAD
ncbi:MAG: ribonuclease P protein component [Thermoleophilia bacterium]|nr:ribonuclease P protein component [Thermoleophilia bacterium]